jgi:hypothetical protein
LRAGAAPKRAPLDGGAGAPNELACAGCCEANPNRPPPGG